MGNLTWENLLVIWSEHDQSGPNGSNGPNMPKVDQMNKNGPKWTKMVPTCPK